MWPNICFFDHRPAEGTREASSSDMLDRRGGTVWSNSAKRSEGDEESVGASRPSAGLTGGTACPTVISAPPWQDRCCWRYRLRGLPADAHPPKDRRGREQ